jgi:hypothetical protein
MSFYLLDIHLKPTYGLCNQIYSIVGTCHRSIDTNIKYLFLNKFLKEINTENYCLISEIIDIPRTNIFLQKYGIVLFDAFKLNFDIVSVKYGNEQFNIDITDTAVSLFKVKNVNQFIIEKTVNLTHIFTDPYKYFEKIYGFTPSGDKYLYIDFKIDNIVFKNAFKIDKNGFFKNKDDKSDININFNFNNDTQFYSPLGYNDGSTVFVDILRNLVFHESLLKIANEYVSKNIDITKPVNVIHLRLEDDAIAVWSQQNNYNDPTRYKTDVSNKYISLIDKYIDKNDTTVIICYDYDNAVVEYMEKNNYIYIKTPKLDNNRDVSAIIDMLIGQYCNKKYICVYESSFSFTLLTRIYNKTNYKLIMFELNDLNSERFIL